MIIKFAIALSTVGDEPVDHLLMGGLPRLLLCSGVVLCCPDDVEEHIATVALCHVQHMFNTCFKHVFSTFTGEHCLQNSREINC
jgi:hypothetical protein